MSNDDDDDDDDDDKDDDGNDDNDEDGGDDDSKINTIKINVPSMGKVRPGCTVCQQGNIHLTTVVSCCHYPLHFTATSA
jgi:hypothetical protein